MTRTLRTSLLLIIAQLGILCTVAVSVVSQSSQANAGNASLLRKLKRPNLQRSSKPGIGLY